MENIKCVVLGEEAILLGFGIMTKYEEQQYETRPFPQTAGIIKWKGGRISLEDVNDILITEGEDND